MKRVIDHLEKNNPERLASFKAGAQAQVKAITASIKDWDSFTGESRDEDGMVALLNYREDGITPYMLFWKDGLIEEKVVCLHANHSSHVASPCVLANGTRLLFWRV